MAGDWLKLEHATLDKPEIFEIAEILGIDHEMVFAKIVRIWVWFDQHSEDGNAPVTLRALLDRKAGVTGFADAMQEVDWMSEIEVDGKKMLHLPNFDRHVGESAKKRALTARRVAKHKKSNAKGNAVTNGKGNADSVTKALPREEKRREDIKEGGSNNQSTNNKQAGKSKATPHAPHSEEKNKTTFRPSQAAITQIRKNCPGIESPFVRERVAEFIEYAAGTDYKPEQLQSRFIRSCTNDFYYHLVNHGDAVTWTRQNNAPPAMPGERNPEYTKRLVSWAMNGKPAPEQMQPQPDFDPMALPGNDYSGCPGSDAGSTDDEDDEDA